MIPILYDKLGNDELGKLQDILSDNYGVEEVRNGVFELTFEYPNDYPLADQLIEENFIEVKPNDKQGSQKFRIYDTKKLMDNIIVVFARHETFDLVNDHVENINLENASCEYALNTLFRRSHFSQDYRGYSDIVNAQDYRIDNANILAAIVGKEGSIIDTYGTGAEILRDGKNIHVLNKRGHDNGVTIEYGKNLTGFELDIDLTGLETRCGGFAKYKVDGSDEEIIVKSDWIDSPFIENFAHPYISVDGRRDYSDKFKDGEIPTKEKLNKLCEDEFNINKRDIPASNYQINFIPLSKCVGYEDVEDEISLCDTVTIIDPRFNINTKAKVISYKYDFIKERYISMELGDPRDTLGSIIGGGSGDGQVGPPGPQGPPGADGSIGDFPNSLPQVPVLTAKVYGFATIEISWTYENKIYYNYEVYASKTKDFTPNAFDLIHAGQSSSFLFQAKPNETWYFRVCAKNTHGERTDFSPQVVATTKKIDDLSNYVDNMAIGEALIGELSLDRGWVGKLNANYLDVKGNFSVTDGNGKRTFDIDSFGNINADFASLSFRSEGIEEVIANGGNLIPNTDLKNGLEGWSSTDNSYLAINEGDFTYMIDYPNQTSKVHFIYGYPNGQSDCQLIQTVTGKNILVDAGLEEQGGSFVKYLKDLGITKLDYVFATHAHSDHIGGMPAIIDNFDIGIFYGINPDPSILDQEEIQWETMKYWQRLKDALHRKGMDVTWPVAGIQLSKYDRLDVYNIKEPTPKMNDMSLVLKYTHMANKIVLSGDVEFSDEDRIASQIGKVDVLKLGHHGLDTSTGYEYINKLKPNMTIFTTTANLASQRIPVLTRLQLEGVTKNLTLGTQGTIVITSNGTKYASSFNQDFSLYNSWGKAYNKDYFFDWGGRPVEGFRSIYTYDTRNVSYYFENNEMKVGWIEISQGEGKLSKWYYAADGTDGVYYLGELVKGFYEVSWNGSAKNWYYFDNNTHEMLRAKWVKHNDNYWYYLKDNGIMAKSETLWIEDGYYTFDANGRMQ